MTLVEQYCKEHQQEYNDWNNRQVKSFLLSPSYSICLILTVIAVTLNNTKAIGFLAYYSFMPSILWHTITYINLKKNNYHKLKISLPSILMDIQAFLILGAVLHYIFLSHHRGVFHYNAPIQLALVILGLLSFHTSFIKNMSRNCLLALCAGGFIYWMDGNYFSNIMIQFPTAIFPVIAVNFFIVRLNRISFYVAHTNIAQKMHAFNQLTKLVYPHQMKYIQNGGHIENSMPQSASSALVLTLDIVGSSKLTMPSSQDLIKRFLVEAESIMMDHYSLENLSANAFLVKELGDGFICTVGFPFACPNSENQVVVIENISKRFALALKETFKNHSDQMPYFSIGVGVGEITAYFSQGSIKKYDVSGNAIIQSARLEAVRKNMFFHQKIIDNLLLIPEEVYQQLPRSHQVDYFCWDLLASNISIRDCNHLSKVYLRYLGIENGLAEIKSVFEDYLIKEACHKRIA